LIAAAIVYGAALALSTTGQCAQFDFVTRGSDGSKILRGHRLISALEWRRAQFPGINERLEPRPSGDP